jgi:hypothetical protein
MQSERTDTIARNIFALTAMMSSLAMLTWITLATLLWIVVNSAIGSGSTPLDGLIRFLGYFTILNNLLCAMILTVHAISPKPSASHHFLLSRIAQTSVAAAMIIVASVYHIALRDYWSLTGLHAIIDNIVHYVIPPAFLTYWWFAVPGGALRWSDFPRILVYPFAYLLYILVRGVLIGTYPYPFLDVIKIGYTETLLNSGLVIAGYAATSAILIGINNWPRPSGRISSGPECSSCLSDENG